MKNIRLISVMLVVFILISSLISCDILDASETQKESSQNVTEAKIETEESESMSSVKGTGVFVGDENASVTVETEEYSSELIITDETVSETVYETISETISEIETVVEEYEGTKVEMFWKEKDRSTIIDDPMNEYKEFAKAGMEYGWVILRVDSYEELAALSELMYGNSRNMFIDIPESYFDENCLVMLAKNEGSGSIWHDIDYCCIKTDGDKSEFVINIKRYSPNLQTEDMVSWIFTVGVKKSDLEEVDSYSFSLEEIYIDLYNSDVMLKDAYNVRVDSDGNSAQYLSKMAEPENLAGENIVIKIDSVSEFEEFTDLLKNSSRNLDFTNKDGNISYADLIVELDAAYFEENSLIITYVRVVKDSLRQRLRLGTIYHDEKRNKDTVLIVIENRYPYHKAENTEGWLICTSLNKKHTASKLYYDVNYTW